MDLKAYDAKIMLSQIEYSQSEKFCQEVLGPKSKVIFEEFETSSYINLYQRNNFLGKDSLADEAMQSLNVKIVKKDNYKQDQERSFPKAKIQ